MVTKKSILREIFSGANGKLSAKRVIGGVAMAVALTCTTILVFRDGSNDVVENLLMTIFITSDSLLGLPAVTGIWKNSKVEVGESKTEEEDVQVPVEPEPIPVEPDPQDVGVDCNNCPYMRSVKRRKGTE